MIFAGDLVFGEIFGPFSLETSGGKHSPKNPWQSSDQNLGALQPNPHCKDPALRHCTDVADHVLRDVEETGWNICVTIPTDMFTRQIPQSLKSATVRITGIPKNRQYF